MTTTTQMINFEAAGEVFGFFEDHEARAGSHFSEDQILMELIKKLNVTPPWIREGLSALERMSFVHSYTVTETSEKRCRLSERGYLALYEGSMMRRKY